MKMSFNPLTPPFDLNSKDENEARLEPTGFKDRTATLSWDDATRTFTITGSHDIWTNGVKTTMPTASKQISTTTGVHYLYYLNGAITDTMTFPGTSVVLIAFVYWNNTTGKGILQDERHGIVMDGKTHLYLHQTVGCRYASGLAGTFTNTTFAIGAGTYYDEDIDYSITEQTTAKVLYHNGDANWAWDIVTTPYKITGGNLNFNTGNTLSTAGVSKFVNYFFFATSDVTHPIHIVVGTTEYNTLALATAAEVPSLGSLPEVETKLLFRVTYKNDGTPSWQNTTDYRVSSNLPTGSYIASDHGSLSGLADNDHPQYVLESSANYVDLTDGGATTLHSHAGGGNIAVDQNGTQVEDILTTLNIVGGDEVTTVAGEVSVPVPRQWGWWDEEGKRRIATSPQKEGNWSAYGVVLNVGAAGAWDDTAAGWPCVVKNPADNLLYMFYNGYGGAGTNYQFGIATSSDGINWTRDANNPFMVSDQTYEGGANKYIRICTVIYDEWETDANKKWKMWYQADVNGIGRDDMCYAYAASPTGTWTKYTTGPVLAGFGLNYGISVTRFGERYVAFVPKLSDGDYYISRSNDGITWTTPVKFITHTAANLEATAVRYGAIFKGVDGYYFFYAAQRATAPTLSICLVTASNPFGTWTRDPLHDTTAIFMDGGNNAFMPSIVNHNGQFLMYYGGVTGGANTVRLAYLKGYDLSGVI